MSIKDFEKVKFLGEGSYARVLLMKYKAKDKIFAVKIIRKSHVRKEKKEYQVKIERDVLVNTNHENIIRLFYTFRDEEKLYFVLEYAPNGELFELLKLANNFSYPLAKHYTAEIVNMLEYLHSKNIAHRDLKPENILLSEEYHLKLADFGTAKFMDQESPVDDPLRKGKGTTFVGTAQYVSPEVLLDQESGPASDLWALGCIIYQFFTGRPPFNHKTEYLTFEAIIKGQYTFPSNLPSDVKDLCSKLLLVDPYKRLGSGPKGSALSYEMLKKHEFFKGIDFANLAKITPPIEPEIRFKLESERKSKEKIDPGMDSPDEECNAEILDIVKTKEKTTELVCKKNPDKIIKEGVVYKKCGWIFYKKRKLVLTSRPRLAYYEVDNGEYKGDVLLTKKVKSVKTNDTKFSIITPNRTYYFEGLNKENADEWVQTINDGIKNYCPELG